MPTSHEVHEDAGVIVLKVAGEVDDDAMLEGIEALRADPRARRAYALLVDMRDQKPGSISNRGVRALASSPSVVARLSRKAVLVSSDLGYGMARMFNLTVGEDEAGYCIFRNEADARAYVRLDVTE